MRKLQCLYLWPWNPTHNPQRIYLDRYNLSLPCRSICVALLYRGDWLHERETERERERERGREGVQHKRRPLLIQAGGAPRGLPGAVCRTLVLDYRSMSPRLRGQDRSARTEIISRWQSDRQGTRFQIRTEEHCLMLCPEGWVRSRINSGVDTGGWRSGLQVTVRLSHTSLIH